MAIQNKDILHMPGATCSEPITTTCPYPKYKLFIANPQLDKGEFQIPQRHSTPTVPISLVIHQMH